MDIIPNPLQPEKTRNQKLNDQSNKESNLELQQSPGVQTVDNNIDYKERELLFQYELVQSRLQYEICSAFAFNKEGNILLVASEKFIYVYQNGQMTKVLQRLTNNKVNCLYFMKQSYSFVSGNYSNLINIWELDATNCWAPKICLDDHNDSIFSIVMNKSENLLISGSWDKTVKFWEKQNNQWTCTQTINTQDDIYSLSLNDYENILIVCGQESSIQVIKYFLSDNTWHIVQIISVCQRGNRLTFLQRNQFIFQPETNDFIELYDFNDEQELYKKLRLIKVQSCENCVWLFPCQFLKQLNILTVKHGVFLNIFKINDQEDYQIIQTIEFECEDVFGIMSDNGQYLASWDYGSNKIQIRRLKYQK